MALATLTLTGVGPLDILQFVNNNNDSNVAIFSDGKEGFYYKVFPVFIIGLFTPLAGTPKILDIPYTSELRNLVSDPANVNISSFLTVYRGYCEKSSLNKLVAGVQIVERINIGVNRLDSVEANNNFLALFDT